MECHRELKIAVAEIDRKLHWNVEVEDNWDNYCSKVEASGNLEHEGVAEDDNYDY